MSSPAQFAHACIACRKLIEQQLEAVEQLERALARSPDDPAVAVLRDKAHKLKAATEIQFLKAMDALPAKGT